MVAALIAVPVTVAMAALPNVVPEVAAVVPPAAPENSTLESAVALE